MKEKLQKVKETIETLAEMEVAIADQIFHDEVISCNDSKLYYENGGAENYFLAKNLFLRNKKGTEFYMIIIDYEKELDFKKLREVLKSSKLMMATKENMKEVLGVETGSVSPFNLIEKKEHNVNLIVDKNLFERDIVAFHPNANIMTLFLEPKEFLGYLDKIDITYNTICFDSYKTKKLEI